MTGNARDALKGLRNGQRVFIGSGCAQPRHLVAALGDAVADLYDVEIIHILTVGQAPYVHEKYAGHVRHNAFFIGPNVRDAVERGDADYTPANLSDIPRLFRSGQIRLDWALIQVSPPDRHGYCSLGVSVDVVRSAIESARRVVAQVNPRMPRTHGDTLVPLKSLHATVAFEEPILEFEPRTADDVAERIGRYVASLIESGSTLQAGIGAIPNAALRLLKDRRDLGVHSEMISDWVADLHEAGAITNRRKAVHPGRIVASFAMGSRRLYDFLDDNPLFEFLPSDYVNDPGIIAQNPRMISINSALSVDLTGQVCADSLGTRFYSGIGGQVDFVRGASRSAGGKSIIALPSTADDGAVSRIAPVLSEGSGVVTARADVQYVITEYGIAELRGQTVRERALALIGIAHPKFREALLEAARQRRILPAGQKAPRGRVYPVEHEYRLPYDGRELRVRPIRPTDADLLKDLFYSQGETAIYYRFGTPLKRLAPEQIERLVNIDYEREFALVALDGEAPAERIVAVARFYGDPEGGPAEMAQTVLDAYQGRGLGKAMFLRLCDVARSRGISGFFGQVHAENARMIKLFHAPGLPVKTQLEGGWYRLEIAFPRS